MFDLGELLSKLNKAKGIGGEQNFKKMKDL